MELAPRLSRRQELWRAFLLGEDSREEEVRRDYWVLGEPAFRSRLRSATGRPAPRKRGRPRQGHSSRAEDFLF